MTRYSGNSPIVSGLMAGMSMYDTHRRNERADQLMEWKQQDRDYLQSGSEADWQALDGPQESVFVQNQKLNEEYGPAEGTLRTIVQRYGGDPHAMLQDKEGLQFAAQIASQSEEITRQIGTNNGWSLAGFYPVKDVKTGGVRYGVALQNEEGERRPLTDDRTSASAPTTFSGQEVVGLMTRGMQSMGAFSDPRTVAIMEENGVDVPGTVAAMEGSGTGITEKPGLANVSPVARGKGAESARPKVYDATGQDYPETLRFGEEEEEEQESAREETQRLYQEAGPVDESDIAGLMQFGTPKSLNTSAPAAAAVQQGRERLAEFGSHSQEPNGAQQVMDTISGTAGVVADTFNERGLMGLFQEAKDYGREVVAPKVEGTIDMFKEGAEHLVYGKQGAPQTETAKEPEPAPEAKQETRGERAQRKGALPSSMPKEEGDQITRSQVQGMQPQQRVVAGWDDLQRVARSGSGSGRVTAKQRFAASRLYANGLIPAPAYSNYLETGRFSNADIEAAIALQNSRNEAVKAATARDKLKKEAGDDAYQRYEDTTKRYVESNSMNIEHQLLTDDAYAGIRTGLGEDQLKRLAQNMMTQALYSGETLKFFGVQHPGQLSQEAVAVVERAARRQLELNPPKKYNNGSSWFTEQKFGEALQWAGPEFRKQQMQAE